MDQGETGLSLGYVDGVIDKDGVDNLIHAISSNGGSILSRMLDVGSSPIFVF